MKHTMHPTDNGKRYELHCPTSMPNASSFLWNRNMLLQLNCRGYCVAQHMQPEPAKYSHAPILEHKTFMQPEQPRYAHHPGRFVYVRDVVSSEIFSAPYEPTRAKLDEFTFSAGTSDVHWRAKKNNIGVQMSVTLPLDDVAELWTIEITNYANHSKKIELFPCFSIGYMSWMNQSASYSSSLGGVIARSITPYQKLEDYPTISTLKDCTVLLHSETPDAWETSRDAFEGEGGIHNPDGVANGALENGDAIYETPIAALQYNEELAAGESKQFHFVFAPVKDDVQAQQLRKKYLQKNGYAIAHEEVKAHHAANQGSLSIATENSDLDNFVNHWLGRQVFYHGDTQRLTTDPQTRNYLQDAMGMNYIAPGCSRSAIVKTLSQQLPSGALPEGVKLKGTGDLKYINQIPHTDHCVWLPIVLQSYLYETGDYTLLTEPVSCNHKTLSVAERTTLAMNWLINNCDDRGLSLIAQGDWCDPLNMVGHKGKGVSGWLTIATVHALTIWAKLSSESGDEQTATAMRQSASEFTAAAQKYFWDGDWFSRGISDDGTPLGVSTDLEGKIWLNPQSWSLMSGVASADQQTKILAAVGKHIETQYGPMVLAPSYTSMKEHIGRVTQKHPGTAENGAIYNHAVTFYIYALYQLGESDRAYAILRSILPGQEDAHYLQRGQLPVFIPNYYRGAVHQFPRTAGRSSQLFNTGAASWLYRILVEQLFGLQGSPEGLTINPQLPKSWQSAKATRYFREATFKVYIKRDASISSTKVFVNGEELPGTVIHEFNPHQVYEVTVLTPKPR